MNHHLKRVFQEPAWTKPAWDFVAAESAFRFEANVFRPGPRRKSTLSHGTVSLQIWKNLGCVLIGRAGVTLTPRPSSSLRCEPKQGAAKEGH